MSFQARIRKLASETAIYGVSSIVGRMVNFLLFPLYSHEFAPDVYGPIIVIYAAFQFLNILYQHGMESSYLKFAAAADLDADSDGHGPTDRRKRVFTTAMTSLLFASLTFSALLLIGRDPAGALLGLEDAHLDLLWYAAGILLLDGLSVVPFADLRLRNRPWQFAGIRFANIGVNVGLNLILIVGMGLGIESILIANLAASATSLVLLLPSTASQLGGGVDRAVWKKLLAFGLPFVPGGLGYALVERLNIFFLERIPPERVLELYGADVGGPDLAARAAELGPYVYTDYVVGAYGGIIKLAVLMALVVQMFRYAWQPFFLQHQRDEDARPLFARVFSLLTLALLTVFLGVSFLAAEIVAFPIPGVGPLIQPRYWLGLPVIPVVLAGFVFQGWYYHISAAAYLSDTTRFFVHATLTGSAAALALNVLFVPTWGMMAAAAATAVSYVVMTTTLYLLTRREYVMPVRFGRVTAAVVAAGVTFGAWAMVPAIQTFWLESLLILAFLLVAARILDVRIRSAVRLLLPRSRKERP